MDVYLGSILLMNCDSVPLSINFAGGLAMVFNFVGCPIACEDCPWSANLDPCSAKVLHWDPRYSHLIKSIMPDAVVLHGAEPYLSTTSITIAYAAKSLGIPLIVKVLGRNLGKVLRNKLMDYVDLLLLEIVAFDDLLGILIFGDRVKDVETELLLVVRRPEEALEMLRNALNIPRKPLSIVVVSSDVDLIKMLNVFKELRDLGFALLSDPTNPSAELASIYCPICGAPIVARHSGVVYKLRMDQRGRCHVCGYPVARYRAHRFIKFPVNEVLA